MNCPDQYLLAHISWMNTTYTNPKGYSFFMSSWLPCAPSECPRMDPVCCVFYYCTLCHHIYVSKKAVDSHDCRPCMNQSTFNPNQTKVDLLIAIAVCDLSFKTVCSKPFRKFVDDFGCNFHISSERQMIRDMKSLAMEINEKNLQSLYGQTVSILFDGAKRVGNNYEGVILYTRPRLYFYPFSILDKEKATDIAKVIITTINDLNNRGVRVIAACSDNASNNIAAFANHSYSVRYHIGDGIIRVPCFAHTSNLATKDVFDGKFKSITHAIVLITKVHPPGQKQTCSFSATRWKSLYECIQYICNYNDFYATNEETQQLYNLIEQTHSWHILRICAQIMWEFTAELEKDHSSICDVFLFVNDTLEKLKSIIMYPIPDAMYRSVRKRFTSEKSMEIPCLSFVCTKIGKSIFNALNDSELQESVSKCAINGATAYSSEHPTWFNQEELQKELKAYLNSVDIPFSDMSYWEQMKNTKGYKWPELAQLAYDVVQIPCSEAPVERFFAHLEKILSPQRRRMTPELVSAISIVKMDYLFKIEMKHNLSYELIDAELGSGAHNIKSSVFVPPVLQCIEQMQSQISKNQN